MFDFSDLETGEQQRRDINSVTQRDSIANRDIKNESNTDSKKKTKRQRRPLPATAQMQAGGVDVTKEDDINKQDDGTIKAQTPLSSLVCQITPNPKNVIIRSAGTGFSKILYTDPELEDWLVGKKSRLVEFQKLPQAMEFERSSLVQGESLVGYGSLSTENKDLVDVMIKMALNDLLKERNAPSTIKIEDSTPAICTESSHNADCLSYNELTTEARTKIIVSYCTERLSKSDLTLLKGINCKTVLLNRIPAIESEVRVRKEQERQKKLKQEQSEKKVNTKPATEDKKVPLPTTSKQMYKIYRRGGCSSEILQSFGVTYLTHLLGPYDNIETTKRIDLVKDVSNENQVADYVITNMLTNNQENVGLLFTIQSLLDIALYDGDLSSQWYVGMEHSDIFFWKI